MIELKHSQLVFSFPEVHSKASLTIGFQRTLRIPDDNRTYPLPPGLGLFPVHHVDDFASKVTPLWLDHGGVMFPMFQSEAMWLNFGAWYDPDRSAGYPFAVVQGNLNEKFDVVTPHKNMDRAAIEGWVTLDAAKKIFAMAGQNFDELKKKALSRDASVRSTAPLRLTQ